MNSIDLIYGKYSVMLCLAVYAYFLWKRPAGNCVLWNTVNGLGAIPMYAEVNYGFFVVGLQSIALVTMLLKKPEQGAVKVLALRLESTYLLVLAVLWAKVGIDTWIYEMDEFRLSSLKIAIFSVFQPLALLYLCVLKQGWRKATRDVVIGLCAFSVAYLLPLLIPIIGEGRIGAALKGISRLSTFGLDEINGGRMFYLGCAGFLISATMARIRGTVSAGLYAVASLFFCLVILNASRQFALAILVLIFVGFLFQARLRRFSRLVLMALLLGGGYVASGYFIDAAFGGRITVEMLTGEAEGGRGAIWRRALQSSLENPWLGEGFRNFGEEVVARSSDGENEYYGKDNAHGFVQEVFAEHGMVLGFALLVAMGFGIARLKKRECSTSEDFMAMVLICLAFVIPEALSCGVCNSFGHQALALLFLFRPAVSKPPAKAAVKPIFQNSVEGGFVSGGPLRASS